MEKLTTTDFIEKARKVHGDKYDYSKTIYEKSNKKVIIICKKHGEFLQRPNGHLNNRGCQQCGKTLKLTKNEFINSSNKIHNNFYNYSKINYINSITKLKIICPIHEEFWQTPGNHLSGKGCKHCGVKKITGHRISKPETEFLNYINITNRNIFIKSFIVDGIEDNTIYEFLGDYWHGNPKKYNLENKNDLSKKTFGELYNHTFDRFKKLKSMGYNIKYIWESDWKSFKKGIDKSPKILTF